MRLIFIRHAEPDYTIDGLTEKGHREAVLLAAAVPALHIDHCYTSPLGRARETAAYCLDNIGKTAVEQEWLEEFNAPVDLNQHPLLINTAYQNSYSTRRVPWDILPLPVLLMIFSVRMAMFTRTVFIRWKKRIK